MSDACSDTTQENQLKHGPNPFIPMLQRQFLNSVSTPSDMGISAHCDENFYWGYAKNRAEIRRSVVCRATYCWFQSEVSKGQTLLEKPPV